MSLRPRAWLALGAGSILEARSIDAAQLCEDRKSERVMGRWRARGVEKRDDLRMQESCFASRVISPFKESESVMTLVLWLWLKLLISRPIGHNSSRDGNKRHHKFLDKIEEY